MNKGRHCPPGTHAFASAKSGARYCSKCVLVPCPQPKMPGPPISPIGLEGAGCDYEGHPVALTQADGTQYPVVMDFVCNRCGHKMILRSHPHGAKASDPGVLKHRHDEVSLQHGHPVRDLEAELAAQVHGILAQAAKDHEARERAKPKPPAPAVVRKRAPSPISTGRPRKPIPKPRGGRS